MKTLVMSDMRTIPAMVKKRWLISLQYPLSIIFWLIAPVLYLIPVLIFGNVINGSRYSDVLLELEGTADIWVFAGLGLAYMNFMFGIMWTTAYAIRQEEFLGTLESIYVTPSRKLTLILSNAMYALTYSGLSLTVQLVFIIWLIGGVKITVILLSAWYVILAVLLVQGLSVMLAALVLTFKQGWRIVFSLQVLISLITPAQFTLSQLPMWAHKMSLYSPFTISIEGFRSLFIHGPSGGIIQDTIILLCWSVVLLFIGLKVYHIQDRKLRSKGKLGKY